MVSIYADLVEKGLRAMEPNDEGILLVPASIREKVRVELKRRIA